jgi:hypothetical protein
LRDTVKVYHFIVSTTKKKIAGPAYTQSLAAESKTAYSWISKEANRYGQNLVFKEYWPYNKDTTLKKNFIYRLPTLSMNSLILHSKFSMVVKKRTKTEPEEIKRVDWSKALLDSIITQLIDTAIARLLVQNNTLKPSPIQNQLFVIHILRAQTKKVRGFYKTGSNSVYIGNNRSRTIAHESIHFLGAPDLYVHRFWPGKRRRIVKKKLWSEIMDFPLPKTNDCNFNYISNYTAYTLGWTNHIEEQFEPLKKINVMADLMLKLSLFF